MLLMTDRILVVDDEATQRKILAGFLENQGWQVSQAASADEALTVFESEAPDLIISDMKMAGMSGMEFLSRIRAKNPLIPFFLITAYGTIDDAVAIMKQGATDYITKPVNLAALLVKITRAIDHKLVQEENRSLRREILDRDLADKIITKSPKMAEVLSQAQRASNTDVPILILGESGTGKELVARTIHELSRRKRGPFVPINCASLNPGVLESELFGHERGAFTGASAARIGRFELAAGGTLFLDEVGDIPLPTQVKLLRVLQDNVIERVGGNRRIDVDFRLICATHRDLRQTIADHQFREDLYYRINVVTLHLPPLRERREDIPVLLDHFLTCWSEKYGRNVTGFSKRVFHDLLAYDYPGNIRELINIVQKSVVLARGSVIDQVDPEGGTAIQRAEDSGHGLTERDLPSAVETLEKDMIRSALERSRWVQVQAAKVLGISERNLRYKMEKYGISNAEKANQERADRRTPAAGSSPAAESMEESEDGL